MERSSMLEPEVKIISRESVKPLTPTPSHLRTFNLSMLDQIPRLYHFSYLMFYNNNNNNNQKTETKQLPAVVDISCLKSALSEALVRFYPLAGRLKDESTINCNDEGVIFVEAHVVNCSVSAVLGSSNKLELLSKLQFCPPKDILNTGKQHISELVHLAFQVNVFSCGGVVIGCYTLHKILDGTSTGLFFKHWSALARNSYHDLIQPDFDSTVIAFPPYHPPVQENPNPDDDDSSSSSASASASALTKYPPKDTSLKIVGKGFTFSDVALTKLKAMAASSKYVLNPTRFESLLGFIWEQCLAAAADESTTSVNPVLLFPADIRKRVGPPLSENSIGNLITIPIAFGNKGLLLPQLVAEIHAAIIKLKDEAVKGYLVGGAEAILAHRRELGVHVSGYKKGTYFASSMCRSGLSEVDFGFGNPTWIVNPVYDGELIRPFMNYISLTDYYDHNGTNGIVAWIYLEEKEMQVLDSNQAFLAFASKWDD